MDSSARDMTLVGLILVALLFSGGIILLHQVITLNNVSPFTVNVLMFSVVFGLGFGVAAGWFFTEDQLKTLRNKDEYRLLGSKMFVIGIVVGLSVFLLVTFLIEMSGTIAFGAGEIYFVISALFTFYVERLVLIVQFERQTKKLIMMDFWKSRSYTRNDVATGALTQSQKS